MFINFLFKIFRIEYENEAGSDPPDKKCASNDGGDTNENQQNTLLIATYATHHVTMEGITFYTEEFRIQRQNSKKPNETSMKNEQFYSTMSLPDNEPFYSSNTASNTANQNLKSPHSDHENSEYKDDSDHEVFASEQIAIAKLLNRQDIRIKMKQSDHIPGPKVQLDMSFGTLAVFISPRHLHLLLHLFDVFLMGGAVAPKIESLEEKKDDLLNQSPMDIDIKNATNAYNLMPGGIGLNHGWSTGGDICSKLKF